MSSELDRQGLVDIFVAEALEAVDVLSKAFHPSDGAMPTPLTIAQKREGPLLHDNRLAVVTRQSRLPQRQQVK